MNLIKCCDSYGIDGDVRAYAGEHVYDKWRAVVGKKDDDMIDWEP